MHGKKSGFSHGNYWIDYNPVYLGSQLKVYYMLSFFKLVSRHVPALHYLRFKWALWIMAK